MLGIIKKDLYLLKGFNTSFFLFLGFFVLMPIFTGAITMVTVMLPIVVSTISINLLAYDRQCDWDQYAAALPVARKQTVLAHYIVSYVMVLLASIIGIIGLIAMSFKSGIATVSELMITAGAGLVSVFIYLAIIIPLTYKYGVEKSRIFILLIVMLPILLINILINGETVGKLQSILGRFSPAAIIAAAVAVTAAACVVSYFISAAVYENKEF